MTRNSHRYRARVLAAALMLTACSSTPADGGDRNPEPSSPPSTSEPSGTQAEVQTLLDGWAAAGSGGVAVALANRTTPQLVLAAGSNGPNGAAISSDAEFRVGSLTKTYVAVMTLQLVDEGQVGLDDLVTQYLPGLTIADGVTIRQLLAHRSGIPEHTDGELGPAVLTDPARTWRPADVLALVEDQKRDFPPGDHFAYSNTNYIIAGLLLEQVTQRSLAENLDERIVQPLGLRATYFAPDPERGPIGAFSQSLPGGTTSGASYRALETAAGAAGAIVSTAGDVAVFIRALADGDLLPPAVYAEMTNGLPADGETLGVFSSYPPTSTGISNAGAIPGFTAFMQYDPATGYLLVLLVNDDTRSIEQLGNDLAGILLSS